MVHSYYPVVTSRQVLYQEMKGMLPAWMSGAAADTSANGNAVGDLVISNLQNSKVGRLSRKLIGSLTNFVPVCSYVLAHTLQHACLPHRCVTSPHVHVRHLASSCSADGSTRLSPRLSWHLHHPYVMSLEAGVHDHLTREGNAVRADKSQLSQSQLNTLSVHVLRSHRDQLVYSVAVLSFLISVGFGILYYAKKHDPQYGMIVAARSCQTH